jgi:hypothetical protein
VNPEVRDSGNPSTSFDEPRMRAYLLTTGTLFGLLTIVHIWRIAAESLSVMKDPFFLAMTIASAGLCVWGFRLLRTAGSPRQ